MQQDTLERLELSLENGFRLHGDRQALTIQHGRQPLIRLPIWPREVDGKNAEPRLEPNKLDLRSGRECVSLTIEHDAICWQFESSREVFDTLACFVGGWIDARQWHTFVFNGHDRVWDASEAAAVQIKSCNEVIGEVRGNWFGNVPPRVAAFDLGEAGWMAVSIPAALSVAETTFRFHNGAFGLELHGYRPTAEAGPLRVYLRPGLASPEDALEFHSQVTRALGYWRDRANHPAWWALPRWGMYDENCHAGQTSLDAPDAQRSPLTAQRVRDWVEQVRHVTGLEEFFVFFDQGYFRRYGEYTPVDSLEGVEGFRRLIDTMRQRGVRTGLYCHPFHVDLGIPQVAAHPEWLVRGHELSAPPVSSDMRLASLDWTHPEARRYMQEVVRRLVSPEPGCLNADWLMVNNNHVPDPRACRLHDPSWGVGDRMAYLVRKSIYETAKRHKPDVLVSFIGCDPFCRRRPTCSGSMSRGAKAATTGTGWPAPSAVACPARCWR
ncbi:MAG TPA: hypothetical protein VF184_13565 [Phycisphaeraceae bacterium]